MGAEYLNLEKGITRLGSIATRGPVVLPEVAPETFTEITTGLDEAEQARLLRDRLVPIRRLGAYIFYADAAPWRQRAKRHPQIVAQVPPQVFAETVWHKFSGKLANDAAHELKKRAPGLSAHQVITTAQFICIMLCVSAFVAPFAFLPADAAMHGLCFVFSLIFFSMTWVRLMALGLRHKRKPSPPERDDRLLPTYSVLVPLHNEANVLPQLVRALLDIDYPVHKLDIKLILEEKDFSTRKAAYALQLPPHMELIVVPRGKPQTKPRALNYALQFARGEQLTVFDAEDIPDPQQLRCAAKAFASLPDKVACLQAELTFHNSDENWLTRQFTVEYAVQFLMILPTLARHRMPLPLGGTSNHFRTAVLRQIHAWDSHNVTEDADLGLRLARAGYRASVLRSVTYEEANVKLGNWLSQRARWLKGFMQTWLVHMRRPSRLLREVGLMGFLAAQTTLLGVALSALLHPIFFGLMIWDLSSAELSLTWLALNSPSLVMLAASYAIMMACGASASRGKRLSSTVLVILSMPVYWLLTSVAGWIALWQLITRPFHWNKTKHGLSKMRPIQMRRVPARRVKLNA